MDLDSVILSEVREGEILYGIPYMRDSKGSVCSAGDLGSTPGLGRSTGEGNGYPVQYSCLQNPHGQRQATVHGVVKSWTKTEGLTLLTLLKRNDANELETLFLFPDTLSKEVNLLSVSTFSLIVSLEATQSGFCPHHIKETNIARVMICHFQREGIVPN